MNRRKDGRWQEAVTLDNGTRKYFYGKTKAEVLRKIAEFSETKERGELFGPIADKWWNAHEPTIAYNTTKGYRPALQRAIDAFGNVPIKKIVPHDIALEIARFSTDKADKTVRTQLLVYNLIFTYAVQKGYIDFNPAREVEVPKKLKKTKRTSPSSADIKRVKESYNCTFGMFAYFALYTGLRKGELLALDWKDIDMKKREISVTKSVYHVGNQAAVKKPKTATSIACVPIPDALYSKLKPGKGLVFPNYKGEYMSGTQFNKAWQRYCNETGVTATAHQFRHAYATMLFENNIPPEEAQALLRHAQVQTTMDVYTDLREEKLKKIHSKVYSIDIE
ncbi:MAG: site-specific integrase [Oscillospiraceae bacterium]|nr:site-specific integrase [Oscillospiraceae bacterium]